ncbi:MAG: bifunctional precorrin-2 dehydrogenase/sirohydrochlorin ferrochelatase [Acidobacteria bacterium]|nr:bifunctional precorrin-2 dehydrogenase/sirohydrochlorin ferrochelatase [Acidobacteriota bacterium]
MALLPVLLELKDQSCLVVGAGRVAARKAAVLLGAGARVRIVAPEAIPAVERMAAAGRVTLVRRRFRKADLTRCKLVVVATDDPLVNRAVASEARRRGLPCNSADDPSRGTLQFPSILRRGKLIIAISTGGASPALSRRLKRDLESVVGPEYAALLRSLGAARRKLRKEAGSKRSRRRSLRRLVRPGALDRLRQDPSKP